MRRNYWPRAFAWIATTSLFAMAASNVGRAACASTREGAAAGSTETARHLAAVGSGFRVISMSWDPLLHQRWALVASCAHPEWPAVELPVPGVETNTAASTTEKVQPESLQPLLPSLPVVRAGDVVQLWSQEDELRIEVAAIAEQSGALGGTVRVRLMQRGTLGQQIETQLNGVVRGPHDVEMQR